MKIDTVMVIDADQYPLDTCFSEKELNASHVIASSNNEANLVNNGTFFGKKMPKIKESADTYLFMALTEVIKQHDISQISLISADKKLLYMLLNLIAWFDRNIQLKLHHLCTNGARECILDTCERYNISCDGVNRLHIAVVAHLAQYPCGLKLKTLSYHFGISIDKMSKILEQLDGYLITKYGNVYFRR